MTPGTLVLEPWLVFLVPRGDTFPYQRKPGSGAAEFSPLPDATAGISVVQAVGLGGEALHSAPEAASLESAPAPGADAKKPSLPEIPKPCSYLTPTNALVTPPQSAFDTARKPVTTSEPKAASALFPGSETYVPATRQTAEIGGSEVSIVSPVGGKATDAKTYLASVDQVAKSLAALPNKTLETIKEVVISPNRNPSDSFWEKTYGMKDFRSAATGSADGVVTFYPSTFEQPQADVDRLFAHEAGHTYSLPQWAANPASKASWQTAMDADPFVPSKYAGSSIEEDFAESHAMYVASKGSPCESTARKLYPNRYKALKSIYGPTKT